MARCTTQAARMNQRGGSFGAVVACGIDRSVNVVPPHRLASLRRKDYGVRSTLSIRCKDVKGQFANEGRERGTARNADETARARGCRRAGGSARDRIGLHAP